LLARVSTHLELARIRREAEEKIRLTMESITDGLHVVDAKGRFTYLNASARRMMSENGVDVDGLIGRGYFEAFPATREMKVGQTLLQSLTERVPTETENFYTPWQRWFSMRHYPAADGGVSTFFLISPNASVPRSWCWTANGVFASSQTPCRKWSGSPSQTGHMNISTNAGMNSPAC
jgi:PAS domain S-box-containing protein